jgi:hypothetical protein
LQLKPQLPLVQVPLPLVGDVQSALVQQALVGMQLVPHFL